MSESERLPGRWLELGLAPGGAGLGPALGWTAGALAAGEPLWAWPQGGWFLLGLFATAAVWSRLWALLVWERFPPPPADEPASDAAASRPLPYTVPGSLSAGWGAGLRRLWGRLRNEEAVRRRIVEIPVLVGLLLVLAGLWSVEALWVVAIGLALLAVGHLLRGRRAALSLLHVLVGLAWPWWLGHAAWAPPTALSLLLSLLWGWAYAGWADLARAEVAGRALRWLDLAQIALLVAFLILGRPLVAGALVFLLLGQALLQAGLWREGRLSRLRRVVWPFAAAGILLTGLVLGGWV